jgi:TRAP-type C4-dicarboxylate transport system permease small subunit
VDQVTHPLDPRDGPQFTVRHMFLTVVYAALALIARKSLAHVSHTWSWVAFGAILIGGITAVNADAGSATHVARWRTLPRILLMLCVGGLFGFLLSRT